MFKHFTKLDYPVFPNLLTELVTMLNSEKITWESGQICLNSLASEPDNYKLGTGSLIKDWKNFKKEQNALGYDLDIGQKKVRYTEQQFTTLCSVFQNTEFEKVYNYVKDKHNIGRTRILKLDPKVVYSWHRDTTPRIHYVLKTNLGSGMIVEDEYCRLGENQWYLVDTTKYHTAYNASLEPRIHLVFTCI